LKPTTSIRLVRPTELSSLLQIAKSTFVDTYEAKNDPFYFNQYLDKHFTIAAITNEHQNPESQFFFALQEDNVVGYFKINSGIAQTEAISNALEVERIYVLTRYKGQGIGRIMINHTIKIAKKQKCKSLWLGVWNQNPAAIGFYKKMGFEVFDTHSFYIGDDEQTDFMMRIEL